MLGSKISMYNGQRILKTLSWWYIGWQIFFNKYWDIDILVDQGQSCLTCNILDQGHKSLIIPWNPNQNKLGTLILINQILKAQNK